MVVNFQLNIIHGNVEVLVKILCACQYFVKLSSDEDWENWQSIRRSCIDAYSNSQNEKENFCFELGTERIKRAVLSLHEETKLYSLVVIKD